MAKIFLVKKGKGFSLCNNSYGVILDTVTLKDWKKLKKILSEDKDGNLLNRFNKKYNDCYYIEDNLEVIFKEDSIVFWREGIQTGFIDLDTKEGIAFLLETDLRKIKKCAE
jgi:hypothetical protein